MKSFKLQTEDIRVKQSGLNFVNRSTTSGEIHCPFIAIVTGVYSDRLACDVKTIDGASIQNVPVLVSGGLVDGSPYGERNLPAIDDYVIIGFASYGQRHKVILGTVIPYLSNEFNKDAVNSGNKTYTKKLLEADAPLEYVRIFKSGSTVQVKEDGSVILETPEGQVIHINDQSGITINDKNGNSIEMSTSSVTINGNLEILQ